MALLAFFYHLLDLWPFSAVKADDLKISNRLVKKLSVPENTKQFVFAICDPGTGSVIYILCAQNLSERSARDAEYLIREVRPEAVIAQVGHSTVLDTQFQQHEYVDGVSSADLVPTSASRVMIKCFMDKVNKDKYEDIAGNLILKEIFGVGFYGHVLFAKRAAEEVGSSFFVLESPSLKSVQNEVHPSSGSDTGNIPSQMVKSLSASLALSLTNFSSPELSSDMGQDIVEPSCNYRPPQFAQAVYPLLMDLHDIFSDIPSMGRALAYAQKMFVDVERGESVDAQVLAEVYTFQVAVEGLRIAFNSAVRLPMHKMESLGSKEIEFSELSSEEKCHCLLAQALRSQTNNFKKVVAIVDSSSLAGLRKYWNTLVPTIVGEAVEELVLNHDFGMEISKRGERKHLLTDKPVVAIGAGATAVLGASSLSKEIPLP
ncbi:hypothetical protein Nepgr_020087 [Nepenthes gracilis]|uniref:Uncharacterized protein n=1 Tax=Nepenthes gracilis TaxID=150966 RepID=A0AAD3SYC4_NEPGR|nr:hypothetical protein Nepgr_020087 [Nepenthes gracilis]